MGIAKTLLIGGFGGCWNFGDIAQLEGVLRYHRKRFPDCVQVVVVGAGNLRSSRDVKIIRKAFGIEHVLAFGAHPPSPGVGFERINTIKRVENLHFYGGGQLNSFWASVRLPVVEYLHGLCGPTTYLVSGQQIEKDIAPLVASHLSKFRASVVGCRDEASVDYLRRAGVGAINAGDDSWEVFSDAPRKSRTSGGKRLIILRPPFRLVFPIMSSREAVLRHVIARRDKRRLRRSTAVLKLRATPCRLVRMEFW